MLSETDIHYVTGFLYVVSRRTDVRVVLGEKVRDDAAGEKRDVDVVIAEAGEHGLIAVEVKDESRPLHVGIVEGLCMKFADMPAIRDRSIVSTSGFTAPAITKARSHGVRCLRLIRGALPRFRTIDISVLREVTAQYLEWREGPATTLAPYQALTADQRRGMSPESLLSGSGGFEGLTLKQLADRVVAGATSEWPGPVVRPGLIPVAFDVEIDPPPYLNLGSGTIRIADARVTGIVEWVTTTIPLEACCYLADDDGQPFAATVLATFRTGLLGLAVSSGSQELRVFHIPEAIRNIRPIRTTIYDSLQGDGE